MTVFLPIRFPGLNEYTQANRYNRFAGGSMKKQYTDICIEYVKPLGKFNSSIDMHFHWVEKDYRRDPDNFIFSKKFILDSLVKCGVIKNDTMKFISSIRDTWEVDKNNVGVYITITEHKE